MENESLQRNNPQGTTLIRSEGTKAIARVLVDVNKLVAFKLEGEEILDWAADLERLASEEDLAKLTFVMDAFKMGHLFYDRQEGIQNVFKSFRLIKKDSNGKFIIMKSIW